MKISLTQGQEMIIDDEDYDKVNQHKWHAQYNKDTKSFYPRGYIRKYIRKSDGTVSKMYAHQVIMNIPPGMQCDHKNHDTLDNRKSNLRICTRRQNGMNNKRHKDTFSSQYKGVSWYKRYKKWRAQIRINGKSTHLGYFESEIDAAKAYDATAKEHQGEFAFPNFSELGEVNI